MTIYLKSTLNLRHLQRIVKCTDDLVKLGETSKLYSYSIPYSLRHSIFKTLHLPIFTNELNESKEYPFTKFISKSIQVFLGKKYFHIKMNRSDLINLNTIINFLNTHNEKYTIFVDYEFTNSDIPFIQNILSKFPDKKINFKLSDIEFSYLKINSIKDNIIYTETECLLERLEIGLPNYYEKDMGFRVFKNDNIRPDVGLKKYYRVEDKRLGFVTEYAMLPKNLEVNSIVILQ